MPDNPLMVFRKKTNYQVRCDFCHRPIKEHYAVPLGTFNYKFCTLMHAQAASENYKEKIAKGITPSNFEPIEEDESN